MSIWADIKGAVGRGLTTRIENRAAGRVIQPQAIQQQAFIAPAVLPAVQAAGRVLSSPAARRAGAAVLGFALGRSGGGNGECPSGWHLNKQDGVGGAAGTYCVRNRRMNVGNARAARRSVRRLKGARKLLKDIEKMMPTRQTRRRAALDHHHHPRGGVV